MRKNWQPFIAFVVVVLLSLMVGLWIYLPENVLTGDKIDGFPVVVADETLFFIQANLGSFSAQERAQTIMNKLQTIAEDTSVELSLLRVEEQEEITHIVIGEKTLLRVTEADAKFVQISRTELANQYLAKIKDFLQTYRRERSDNSLTRAFISIIIAMAVLFLLDNKTT